MVFFKCRLSKKNNISIFIDCSIVVSLITIIEREKQYLKHATVIININLKNRNVPGDTFDVTDFITEFDTIIFVRMLKQFGPESGRDKLGVFRQLVDHVCNSFPVLSIKGLTMSTSQ